MDAMDIRHAKRKPARDKLAARVILQSYLDASSLPGEVWDDDGEVDIDEPL